MKNPYPYSEDNKRYQTFNYYTKSHYGTRMYKVPLEAGFTCPNRDGTKGYGGCIFCGGGSNSFPDISGSDLYKQYLERKEIFIKKWPNGLPMAYFQSYTNTYAPLERLKEVYTPFIENEEVYGIVIATRSDCLSDETIEYLKDVANKKEVWLELGLQSIHDETLKLINRGHDYANFLECVNKLADTRIKISVHLINGLPNESKEMMLETAKVIGKLPVEAVKIHMLHVLNGTTLGDLYEKKPFPLLSKKEYTEIVAEQLLYLRPDMAIERITGDGLADQLLAPEWTKKKVSVINDIDKIMAANDWWQGMRFEDQ